MDRGDNFIGTVFVGGQNLAVMLLEAGLAKIFGFSAQRSTYYTDLLEAETKAKEQKLKLWENYVEQVEVSEGEASVKGLKDVMEVHIVDVSDAVSFYVRLPEDPNIEIVEKRMVEYNESPSTEPLAKPSKGKLIAAKYHVDDQWYRVRYDGPAGNEHKVFFVDFGNPEVMPKERLAALPEDLAKIPGKALFVFASFLFWIYFHMCIYTSYMFFFNQRLSPSTAISPVDDNYALGDLLEKIIFHHLGLNDNHKPKTPNRTALARSCYLAGLKSPSKNSDYFHDAAVFTNELIMVHKHI